MADVIILEYQSSLIADHGNIILAKPTSRTEVTATGTMTQAIAACGDKTRFLVVFNYSDGPLDVNCFDTANDGTSDALSVPVPAGGVSPVIKVTPGNVVRLKSFTIS